MSLGENIYRLRSRKNLSQGDLADLLAGRSVSPCICICVMPRGSAGG